MKKFLLFILVSLLPASGFAASEHEGTFTQHYPGSIFKVSENGLYSVEMLIPAKKLKIGVNAVDIIIHDTKDDDVLGAKITVTPWMPEMGHGVSEQPTVMERGGGLYSIDNILVTMAGIWDLRVKVHKDGIEDSAIFRFPDVHPAGETHEHMPTHTRVPEGLSFSHIAPSKSGIFRVAFLSSTMPVPINKVHGWKLYIESTDGMPVTDAVITIDGDMPEHGHGLPTAPRVKRNLGEGIYELEGMKFQMPGWWVVKFTVSSGEKKDQVTFNLMLQ